MSDELTIAKKVHGEISNILVKQISETLKMHNQGDTVPFMARYRKERTGNLDEVQIQNILDTAKKINNLDQRKQEVIKIIKERGKMTPVLKSSLDKAQTVQEVEDLYLPYKKKRRTKATIAKERGLTPLAISVLKFADNISDQIKGALDPQKKLPDQGSVIQGIHEILAEAISEKVSYREWIRNYTWKNGDIVVSVKRNGKANDEDGVFLQYYDFDQPVKSLPSFRTLAINRGVKQSVLNVKISVEPTRIFKYLESLLISNREGQCADIIRDAINDSYSRFIAPATEREIRNQLSDSAASHAIDMFGKNLYNLLMQAPLKGKIVMGFDPAYRTGCKLAIVDKNGKFLAKKIIYPHEPAPESKRKAAQGEFIEFLEKYQVEMIAIGNGTASRESELFVSEVIKKISRPIYYVIVNEAGASVYSASEVARREFPDFSVEQRSAVSIGRRLQDPLSELVKIDPKSIGVGQYQHDVPESKLSDKLDQVVEIAVNRVGVNVNTASPELLEHISGLTKTSALNLVQFRNENGTITDRQQVKKVPRIGPKAFEQCVGFLRIIGGKNPLDNTDIHPESYGAASKLLKIFGLTTNDLGSKSAKDKFSQIDINRLSGQLEVGKQTLSDIIAGIETPGRDLRDEMPAPLLRKDVLTFDDLKPGMKLQGTVRNVVDFGAFVDIGVKQDGLVHISKMSQKYISDPSLVVSVGDIVNVWVEGIDKKRNRIQLSMIDPTK